MAENLEPSRAGKASNPSAELPEPATVPAKAPSAVLPEPDTVPAKALPEQAPT